MIKPSEVLKLKSVSFILIGGTLYIMQVFIYSGYIKDVNIKSSHYKVIVTVHEIREASLKTRKKH